MPKTVRWTVLASLAFSLGAGCANFVESRAIQNFADRLQSEDLDGLKQASSHDFSERALRTATALQDIKILRLPDGKVNVMEVEFVDESHRRVTVEMGEGKREVFYELVRSDDGKWVVDDVYLKQKKLGVTTFKSVTEQMDLLLTVREFIDACDAGDRNRMLQVTDLEFSAALERLPPSYLARLIGNVLGEKSPASNFKPQAQLDETTAVVKLPRMGGDTILTLSLHGTTWRVTDVAIDSKKEEDQLPSMHKHAIAVNTCVDFLDAYQRDDKVALAPLCDEDLFSGSLSIANLKQVLLPGPQLIDHELSLKLHGQRADFLLKGEREVVQIEMHREDSPEPNSPPHFLVKDVTIYEVESRQEKRLAALFTAQSMLQLFCEALAERDLDHLKHSSTQDFANSVWRRLNSATIQGLPLEMFDSPQLDVNSMQFLGALTRVEATQGGQPVTYLLREEAGRFYVDDVLWQTPGRPASVKETLALLIPVQNFSAAVALGRGPQQQAQVLQMLQETCSTDFNRMVWQQTDFVPNGGLSSDTFLATPLRSVVQSETEVLIQLGDDRFGAAVKLRKEHNRNLVDEVLLIAGPEPADRIEVKRTMRTLLANGQAVRPGQTQMAAKPAGLTRQKIQTAVYEELSDDVPQEILQVGDQVDIGPIHPAAGKAPARLAQ
ncbi:hypothetical protein GC163_18965 [bacterium]|nr:hypothetical protein [bacterium]